MGGVVHSLTGALGLNGDQGDLDAANGLAIQNRDLYNKVSLPNLDWRDIEALQLNPELAQYQLIQDNPSLKADQAANLNQLKSLSETGLSDVDQAAFEKARQLGNQVAQGQSQAAIQDAQNRGVAGSGLEFAMREAAAQNGATRAQDAGLQQAASAAQQRALYNKAFGDQLAAVRAQDLGANSANAGIINQFNQANTNTKNQAQAANQANIQNTRALNQNQRNATKQQSFGNEMQKIGGQAGANNQMAQNYLADSSAKAGAAGALLGAGTKLGAAYLGAAHGGVVPNCLAKGGLVKGDSPKNDVVHALLSPGEIVIPRSHTRSVASAKAFVDEMAHKPHPIDMRMHALKKMAMGV